MHGMLTDTVANILLDWLFGGVAITPPETFHFGLSTRELRKDGTGPIREVELNSGGYSRVAIANNTTNFPAASGHEKVCNAAVNWPQPTQLWPTNTNPSDRIFGILAQFVTPSASGTGNVHAFVNFGTDDAMEFEQGSNPRIDAGGWRITHTFHEASNGVGSLTDMAWRQAIDRYFGNHSRSAPGTYYLGLSRAFIGANGSGADEPSGNGYARVAIPNNLGSFSEAVAGNKYINIPLSFPAPSGDWGVCRWLFLADDDEEGDIWAVLPLVHTRNIGSGDPASVVAPEALNFSLT